MALDLFGPGKHGFRDGDPVAGIPATRLDDAWHNHVQEEIARVIEGTGEALDPNRYDQLKTAIQAMIDAAIAAMPSPAATGTLFIHTGATPPSDAIVANGPVLSRATFPELWAFAAASGNLVSEAQWSAGEYGAYSTGDDATTFRAPDVRGEFLRFFDGGRGVDSGRVFGSPQADELKSHIHRFFSRLSDSGNALYPMIAEYSESQNYSSDVAIGATGGTETRPRNVAYLPCIRI